MKEATKQSMSAVLKDAHPEHSAGLPVQIVANDSAISIFPEGFGDFASAEGHGCPVFLELYESRLRLVVFADLSREDPTHVIDLEGAREDRQVEQDC